jgi:hypothetical protein
MLKGFSWAKSMLRHGTTTKAQGRKSCGKF